MSCFLVVIRMLFKCYKNVFYSVRLLYSLKMLLFELYFFKYSTVKMSGFIVVIRMFFFFLQLSTNYIFSQNVTLFEFFLNILRALKFQVSLL